MKRLTLVLVALALVLVLVTACAPAILPGPGAITDDWGRTVNIAETPQRIVSLAPSITEILFALGLGDKVVGVTDRCDYPPELLDRINAGEIQRVGGYFMTSLEAIIASKPRVVFTDGHDPVGVQLEGLGVTMMVLQPQDIAGILGDIELVGEITGKEVAAAELVAEMEQRIGAVAARTAGVERPTVLYIIDATDPSSPWTVGPGSFINALITLAGGENIVKVPPAYFQISLEEVVASDPQMIIGPASHGTSFLPDFESLPVWQDMSAVEEERVYLVEDDLVSRFGPRIVEGLEEMARIIHPELFP